MENDISSTDSALPLMTSNSVRGVGKRDRVRSSFHSLTANPPRPGWGRGEEEPGEAGREIRHADGVRYETRAERASEKERERERERERGSLFDNPANHVSERRGTPRNSGADLLSARARSALLMTLTTG